jgi:hypothetical protein
MYHVRNILNFYGLNGQKTVYKHIFSMKYTFLSVKMLKRKVFFIDLFQEYVTEDPKSTCGLIY